MAANNHRISGSDSHPLGRASSVLWIASRTATAVVIVMLLSVPVAAQNTDTGNDTGNTGQQAGGQGGEQQVGLSADEVFSGGVERGGAVGQAGDTAVGANPATQTAAGGRGGGGGFGGLGGGLGAAFGNLFGNTGGGGGSGSTPAIRTRLRSAVVGPMTTPMGVQQSANIHLQSVSTLAPIAMQGNWNGSPQANAYSPANPYGDIQVHVQNRTAVLQGSVRSESDRRMSELLLRLEPGVSRVDNRVRVLP